jgi:hypothetical protein
VISRKVFESVQTYTHEVQPLVGTCDATNDKRLRKIFKTLGKIETSLLSKVCQFAKLLLSHATEASEKEAVIAAWAQLLCMWIHFILFFLSFFLPFFVLFLSLFTAQAGP